MDAVLERLRKEATSSDNKTGRGLAIYVPAQSPQ
jgi:hypothetical protein